LRTPSQPPPRLREGVATVINGERSAGTVRARRASAVAASLAVLGVLAVGCEIGGNGEEAGGGDEQASPAQRGGNLLQRVKDRGNLSCGVNNAVPGFGFVTAEGEFQGFDIEFCRAVAAGILGDADAVEFKPLTAEQRFTALQSGEIDALIRNTTWTSSRDGSEGANFLTSTFYDGQGMMVKSDTDVQTLEDLEGATICVLSGTTTELNLASQFGKRNLAYTPLSFEDNDALQQAFIQARCDAWTSDKSQLAGVKSNWPENQGGPDALRILDETMSKEPLGPVVRDGQERFGDAINWIVIATMQAEEFGITSENVDQMLNSNDPEIRRFLGQPVEGEAFDPGLGLPADFAVQVIEQVGNYAEIYERTVGPETALGLERGLNELWTNGGLHYPPPYR
jgi:general L-amino acid transport system substrate-binding protein